MVISTFVHNNTYVYCICICLAIIKDGWPLWKDRSNPNNYIVYEWYDLCLEKGSDQMLWFYIHCISISLYTISWSEPFSRHKLYKRLSFMKYPVPPVNWRNWYAIDIFTLYSKEQNLWRHYTYLIFAFRYSIYGGYFLLVYFT